MSELMATKQLNSLRPCPFCGAEAIMPVFRNASPAGYKVDVCTCSNDCEVIWDWKPIEAWNTRPIEDALNKRIAELEAELSNKKIEYTDLWDDALALQARAEKAEADNIALKTENAELKERVAMLDITGVFKNLGEMGNIEQIATLREQLQRAEEMVERLIVAGEMMIDDPAVRWFDVHYKWRKIVAEWKEAQ